jgi:hypothetical protein
MSRLSSQITIRRLIDAVTVISMTAIITAWCAWVLLNAITGCGERTYNADGTYTVGVCIYHPFKS